jgi:hypothetical protein
MQLSADDLNALDSVQSRALSSLSFQQPFKRHPALVSYADEYMCAMQLWRLV